MLDVFFYEAFEEEARELKRFLPAGISADFTSKTIQEHPQRELPAPIISIRTQSHIPPAWSQDLRALLTRSTGYDHLQAYKAAVCRAIPCGYLPTYCARAVAEHAAMLWMSLLRKLPQQVEQFKKFHRDGLTGHECEHKTLLVVGVGQIGYEVVKIGVGLGMNVMGVDVVQRHSDVHYVGLEQGLSRAHVVVCAMNLTPLNQGLFHFERLQGFRKGCIFINIARGEMSPTRDLLRAVNEGILGGVGLDVYEKEIALATALRSGETPIDDSATAVFELARLPNVILTPHNAFNTRESVERKAEQTMQQVGHFLKHGFFLWPVPDRA